MRVVYKPSSADLPGLIARKPIRPEHLQGEDFREQFDYKTFYYDLFCDDGSIICISPPDWGFDSEVDWASSFSPFGPKNPVIQPLDRSLRVVKETSDGVDKPSTVRFNFKDNGSLESAPLSSSQNNIFADQRVLLTMSKDNQVSWIRDWAKFHREVHGATGLLIYDNNSSSYTAEALLAEISDLPLESIVVVDWRFKYGPQGMTSGGSYWDSDFCQYGGLEHARYFFLSRSSSFLQCDVDELVLPLKLGASVFEVAEHVQYPIYFPGQWIEAVDKENFRPKAVELRRHADFAHVHRDGSRRFQASRKYCVSVKNLTQDMQVATHAVKVANNRGEAFPSVGVGDEFRYCHFKAITNNWKWTRDSNWDIKAEDVEIDPLLRRMLDEYMAKVE